MADLTSTPLESGLYVGRVRHRRFTPIDNAFTYSGYWVYLDLDELDRVFAGRWLWSTSRAALARFSREDHLLFPDDLLPSDEAADSVAFRSAKERSFAERKTTIRSLGRSPSPRTTSLPPLQDSIRDLVRAATGSTPTGPIRLLTQLRMVGYLINPVSYYYCFDATGLRVETVIAEVNNTPWGERHCYVLSAGTGEGGTHENSPQSAWPESVSATLASAAEQRLRFEHAKRFHVSPFMNLEMDYRWSLVAPGPTLTVHIENWRASERLFDVTLHLQRREITGSELAGTLCRHPFMTGKVAAAIYWQALKLWWKRCPFVPHPNS